MVGVRFSILFRWAATIALLSIVWMNSHWSVGLTLTLLGVNAEIDAYVKSIARLAMREERLSPEIRERIKNIALWGPEKGR